MAQETPQPPARATPDDFALFDSIAAGDAAALETLYNRHGAAVFSLCARIVGDKTEAEDVLIDVFNQIWTRGGQFDPTRGAPITYILTIARSRALDHRRTRRSQGGTASLGVAPNSAATMTADEASNGPVARLVASEAAHRVRAALARLEPGQRRAIEMSFFDGLSHAQIAEQLRRPLGTIKTIIRQGLIQLRQCVRIERDGGPDDQ